MSTNLSSLYGSLYGSLYFATILSTAFYGVTCIQTFFYYVHYHNDPLRTKILVASLWGLNTIHEALSIAGTYKNIMAGLLNPLSFVSGNPELVLLFLFTVLVSVPTQGFFVYRIYIFSGKNVIAPLVWVVFALLQLACASVYVAKTLYTGNGIQIGATGALDTNSVLDLATFSFSAAAGVDILIAMFMTLLLVRKQASAGLARSAHLLQRLTVFSVNTGIWTAMFALLSLILLHVFPSNLIYAVFGIPLCSIYCNTLLANLNARAYVRSEALTRNIDMDIFSTSPSSRLSENTKPGDTRRSEVFVAPSANQSILKTKDVSTFQDGSRSAAVENVGV